ncbi:exported protein IBIS1 [Plasmodium berghei]|uniref:Exported protein IBIS1 n=2 Tax=Plasmodium berghei TaxID=5821 RepID=A0A509AT96_PLABA|nr:exported protein IBIS1 [Plasmodium berghei ANKA]CXJ06077.1 exported protein IBIS1 [Plasmodium berghei]SCL98909.1 exported protein IBIS1 [Plasmodium berghei]SCM16928.1 exported protein IBIS1 [Plasmodium berghei]SCM18726.1 exported protein IBIS1 [Plasmodium berghei]SCN28162.1 exported protein IBIS1 [Plasmodium berghei]|eukprot:XP_034423811.1 exported protein IBIS1 [Plasmodium berghei ANKA]
MKKGNNGNFSMARNCECKKIDNDDMVSSTRYSNKFGEKFNLISCTKLFALGMLFLICKNCDNSTQTTSAYQEYQYNGLILGKSRILSELDQNKDQNLGYKTQSYEDSSTENASTSYMSTLKTDEESNTAGEDRKEDNNDAAFIGKKSTEKKPHIDRISSTLNPESTDRRKSSDEQKSSNDKNIFKDVDDLINGIKSRYQDITNKIKSPEFQNECKGYINVAKEMIEDHRNHAMRFVSRNLNSLGIDQIFNDEHGGYAFLAKIMLTKVFVDNLFVPNFLKNNSTILSTIVYFLIISFIVSNYLDATQNNERERKNLNKSNIFCRAKPM